MQHVSRREIFKSDRIRKGRLGTVLAWYVLCLSIVAYDNYERAGRFDRDCELVAPRDVFRLPVSTEPTDVENICPHPPQPSIRTIVRTGGTIEPRLAMP
jgi:hypothetical protein